MEKKQIATTLVKYKHLAIALLKLCKLDIAEALIEIIEYLTEDKPSPELEQTLSSLSANKPEDFERLKEIVDSIKQLAIPARKPIIAVGSASVENVLKCSGPVILGEKHSVELQKSYGGSGLNFTFRLLAARRPVIPVLPIGKDDTGKTIRNQIDCLAAGETFRAIRPLLHQDNLLGDKIRHTPCTTIIVSGGQRTIFSQHSDASADINSHLHRQLKGLLEFPDNSIGGLILGHIPSDHVGENQSNHSSLTAWIIEQFGRKGFLYVLFGKTQYELGWNFWKDKIHHVDVLQLNIREAKIFFRKEGRPASLMEILSGLRAAGLTAILTMDRFGAIGTFRNSNSVFIASPLLEPYDVVDSTGAGDAFAAGMIAELSKSGKGFSSSNFSHAISQARIWAGCACTTTGGSGEIPRSDFKPFDSEHKSDKDAGIEIKKEDHAQEILKFIDLAFQ
jgi:sugar/nucleoside kinase (ribokinase family)